MDYFKAARSVSALDAAKHLGIPLKRSGARAVARCVFHPDRTPSMVLYPEDGGFHCFGCGAHGDATALYQQVLNLSPLEAAQRLCSDFGIAHQPGTSREPRADARMLRRRILAFRSQREKALMKQRQEAQRAMAEREEALSQQQLPFEEWWDDPLWADAKQREVQASEELCQLDGMTLTELWQLEQQTKEETNGSI